MLALLDHMPWLQGHISSVAAAGECGSLSAGVMRCLLSASPWWSNHHFNDNVDFAVGFYAAPFSLHVILSGLVPSNPPFCSSLSS